jgi:hypothetical protein
MCIGIFSCMNEKKLIAQATLNAMDELFHSPQPDERSASQLLSLADRLWTTVATGNRNRAGSPRHHTELFHAADALYQQATALFDDPTSTDLWHSAIETQRRCRYLFDLEMKAFQAYCS